MRVGTAGRAGHLADDPASSMVVTSTCPLVLARIGCQPEVPKPAERQMRTVVPTPRSALYSAVLWRSKQHGRDGTAMCLASRRSVSRPAELSARVHEREPDGRLA